MSTTYTLFTQITEQKNTASFTSATQAFMKEVGIDCSLLMGGNGDGGYEGLVENEFIFLFANARNMALAAKHGRSLVCSDDVSYCNIKLTHDILAKRLDIADSINRQLALLELRYEGDMTPIHIIDLILEQLSGKSIKHAFDDFQVALHYGNDVGRMRNYRDIANLQKLATLLGAQAYEVSTSSQFSGYETLFYNKTVAHKSAGDILLDAIDSGADFVLTSNAASFYMLDALNKEAACSVNRDTQITILHPAQMACLALGVTDKKSLGFDLHQNPVTLI